MIDDGYFNLEEVPANEDFNIEASDDEFGDFRREEDRESKQDNEEAVDGEAQFDEEVKEPEIYKEIEMNKPNEDDHEGDEEEYVRSDRLCLRVDRCRTEEEATSVDDEKGHEASKV
jgi:hypothetical protein